MNAKPHSLRGLSGSRLFSAHDGRKALHAAVANFFQQLGLGPVLLSGRLVKSARLLVSVQELLQAGVPLSAAGGRLQRLSVKKIARHRHGVDEPRPGGIDGRQSLGVSRPKVVELLGLAVPAKGLQSSGVAGTPSGVSPVVPVVAVIVVVVQLDRRALGAFEKQQEVGSLSARIAKALLPRSRVHAGKHPEGTPSRARKFGVAPGAQVLDHGRLLSLGKIQAAIFLHQSGRKFGRRHEQSSGAHRQVLQFWGNKKQRPLIFCST